MLTSLVGKEPELVCEFERYWLDIVNAWLGLWHPPQLAACMLGFLLVDERACSVHIRVGEQVLTVVCTD